MIIRRTADVFTKLVTILLWIAVIVSVIITIIGIGIAAEQSKYGGNFALAFVGVVGVQLVGALLFVLLLGMFAVFIDIRLILMEIRDNGLGLLTEPNKSAEPVANKSNDADRSKIKKEPTLTTKSTENNDFNWQNTDQFGAIAKDASGNSLREFIDANQSIFEAKGVTTKVVHGGKSWLVDLNGSKGTKSFNQSQLQSLIEWVDED